MGSDGEFPWDIRAITQASLGWSPSDDQLKYWREKGVISSRGDVPHPSGRGRVSLYVVGTGLLVVRLRHLLLLGTDLAPATWTLWIERHPVDEQAVRNQLIEAARSWDTRLVIVKEKAFEGADESRLSDAFLDWIENNPRFSARAIRLTRKLVGTRRFASYMYHMLRLALGHQLPVQEHWRDPNVKKDNQILEEHSVVVSGLGFERMIRDRALRTQPADERDIIIPLNKVARRLFKLSLVASIESATDATLLQAAREIQAIQENNRLLFGSISWLFGIHAFGRGHAARVLDSYTTKNIVMLTALWVAVRDEFLPGTAIEVARWERGDVQRLYELSAKVQSNFALNPELEQQRHKEMVANISAEIKKNSNHTG